MIALVVCIIGGIIYLLATRPQLADGTVADLGKWAYIIGLFFTLLAYGGKAIL